MAERRKNKDDGISIRTLERMPIYLSLLEKLKSSGVENVSAPTIASCLGLTEILVKKDLMFVTKESGKPKIGHRIDALIHDIKEYLGYNNVSSAVLVGAGKLGRALLGYNGFKKMNVEIAVAFDSDKEKTDTEINGIKIVDINKLEDLCQRMNLHIGIITTDEDSAQEICDRLIASGIKAIWNFAPTVLNTPPEIIVKNENLAASLAVLSKKLENKMEEK